MRSPRAHSAFTLVELMIVVVILGILASVVIPMFADASSDAQLATLESNLATIRAQLELYKLQHSGNYPSQAQLCDDGAGAVCDPDVNNLEIETDANGDAGAGFGPYLVELPPNPFSTTAVIDVTAANCADDGSQHWYYNGGGPSGANGFKANDSAAHRTDL